ncbi:hypothetical protein SAMN05216382_0458 [Sphingomonas palmae]|uniref:Uncharacterized protein n=1 Tax=Sphingomonas palmae TaxID=1855283 RepID=A0A1H7H7U6_9SPHN|nr:hypothetical protein [Sphingomonas palmae]SEK46371.1 hypothetical protein SAMN05216382_0458 [Sphingomonas palmae]
MSLTLFDELTPYIRALLLLNVSSLEISGEAKKRSEVVSDVHYALTKGMNGYDIPSNYSFWPLTEQLLEELAKAKVIHSETIRFAGEYYTYINSRYPAFRKTALETNAIASAAGRIGGRLFPDVFAGYTQEAINNTTHAEQLEEREPSIPVSLSENKRISLINEIGAVEARLDDQDLSNADKAQARAFLNAAKALTEAPEPPADLIWEILNRANSIAGIASLFVTIIAIFLAN